MEATTTTTRAVCNAGEISRALRAEEDLSTNLVVRYRWDAVDLEIHRHPWGGRHTYEVLPVAGRINGSSKHSPEVGAWLVHGVDPVRDIVDLLPKTAEVRFVVALGGKTNQYMQSAVRGASETRLGEVSPFEGLHGDALYLEATFEKRGKAVRKRFLLDTSVTPHNSARFGVSN